MNESNVLLLNKNHIVLDVMKNLNISNNVEVYYNIGTNALADAVNTYDQNGNETFDQYAYQAVTTTLQSELIKQNQHSKLCLTLLKFNCGQVTEIEVIREIDLNYFYQDVSTVENKIVKLIQSGFKNFEITEILNISLMIFEKLISKLIKTLASELFKIDIN